MKTQNNTLIDKLEGLRNFLHASVIAKTLVWEDENNNGSWSKLWTSFDNIYDAQQAIERFKLGDTGKLGVFGLLQAMTVQQDAIKHLEQAVGLNPTLLTDMPILKEIRNVRDETVGHPTNTKRSKGKNTYQEGTITYTSMWAGEQGATGHGFLEYYIWSNLGSERKSVDLNAAISDQGPQLSTVLQKVINELEKKETAHKNKFKGNRLNESFHQVGYLFSKLYSSEHSREHSKVCFNDLDRQYQKFKDGIVERYGKQALSDSQAVPGTYEECKKLDEIMKRIRARIMLPDDTDDLELDVYVESAQHSFEELEKHARLTDERFIK